MTTTDSNAWSRHSGHTYTLARRSDGTTDVDYVVVRNGKNLRGWFLAALLDTIGRSAVVAAFQDSVKAIESRSLVLT